LERFFNKIMRQYNKLEPAGGQSEARLARRAGRQGIVGSGGSPGFIARWVLAVT
jgi:hypothetical protein